MFLVSSCNCLCTIYWNQVLSQEWRCSWSSANRRCSNYIWVIDNFVAYWGASYIRDLTVSRSKNFKILAVGQVMILRKGKPYHMFLGLHFQNVSHKPWYAQCITIAVYVFRFMYGCIFTIVYLIMYLARDDLLNKWNKNDILMLYWTMLYRDTTVIGSWW